MSFSRKVLLMSIVNVVTAKVFENIDNNSHFERKGKVALVTERADLVVDIDLRPVEDAVLRTCDLVDAALWPRNSSNVIEPVRVRLSILCELDRERWVSVKARVGGFGGFSKSRNG